MSIESSNFHTDRIEIEPRHLLCLNCLRGGGRVSCMDEYGLDGVWQRIQENPEIHLTLVGAFDEVGARTERFYRQTPMDRRKDLDVLQRLGLCYGDTRTARDLMARIVSAVPDLQGVCKYPENEYGVWPECPLSDGAYYAKGKNPLPWAQNPEQMRVQKLRSCRELAETDRVFIRAHHLLCIVCYIGRGNNETPLAEDNLYEAWVKFRENPDIPVTLIEGPGECCICPPCHGYHPERGVCVAACHLRDRKKDLDTFVALGLSPGDTLTARELYRRIYEKIPRAAIICGYETDNSPEWASCGSARAGGYENGLAHGVIPE